MRHLLLWLLARAASPLGAAPRRGTRLRAMSLDDAAPVAIDGDESLVAAASVAYDPDAAEASLWRRPAAWLARNVELLLPLVGFVGRVAGDRFVGREASLRERRASELRKILGSLGPAVIKAGQALASRPDLLPAEYLRELQKLQDRVPAFDTGDALRRVEASLGLQRFDDAFELLEAEPIAAASIGQVYKARLIKEDVVVALKVQRRAGQECEIPNFKGSYLGRFPLVSADFWTSDHLSERSRSVDVFSVTRARGILTLKRR